MDWLFFLFAALSLALSINVVRPVYRHPKHMVYSFILGWPIGELALHVVFFQAVLVFLVVLWGELNGFLDALSLMLFVASWFVLTYQYFSGFRAKAAFSALLSKELNVDVDWIRWLRPFNALKDKGLVVDKNIVYREIDGMRLKLDVRRKTTAVEDAPVLLQIHGGAWTKGYGSKNEQGLPLMQSLAKAGWVCVSIDYRLSPKATFPEHIIDCKHALAWVKDNIANYGGDANYIVVTGGSAGGHLSSLLALSEKEDAFHDGLKDKDLSVQGCVPFYGIYDLLDRQGLQKSVGLDIVMRKSIIKQKKSDNPDLYQLMSPVSHISKTAPPFLIIHGDKDSLTSFDEARYFVEQLKEQSSEPVEFVAVEGAQHAFEMFPSLRSDVTVAGVVAVLNKWHAQYKANT